MSGPDVLVVGGGPAGSTVATLLARRGVAVTLLDRARFPRPKACGECVNPGGVDALRRLGLLDAVEALDPRRLTGWDIVTGGGRTARGRFAPEVEPGLAVERSRLDAALLDEARRAGVRVEEGVRVVGARAATRGGCPSVLATRDGRTTTERHARVVVGADGLRSVVADAVVTSRPPARHRKLSLTLRLEGDGPPDDRGRLHLASDATVGLAPVGPARWNATVVVDADARGREVARVGAETFAMALVRERVPSWSTPPEVVGGPWGSGGFDVRTRRASRGGVVLVGDAAGYYDPLTGQGIYRALRSAELAAEAVVRVLTGGGAPEPASEAYERSLAREFGPGRRVQRAVEAVVSRERVREAAVGVLARAPRATDALIRVTGDARPVRSLLRAAVWRDLLTPTGPASPERSASRRPLGATPDPASSPVPHQTA